VLSADPEVMADVAQRFPRSPPADRLPAVVWSRLRHDLELYLSERRSEDGFLLSFYHRTLQEVATSEFLAGRDGRTRHGRLADYFKSLADPSPDSSRV
jgi:hypothetical protein